MILSAREKKLALWTGSTVGLGLLWAAYLSPTIQGIQENSVRAETLETRVDTEEKSLALDRRTASRLPAIERRLAANRVDSFLDVVRSARADSGMEQATNIATGDRKQKDFTIDGRQLRLTGSLPQLVSLLALLDAQEIPLAIGLLSIQTEDGKAFDVTMQLTTVTPVDPPPGPTSAVALTRPPEARQAGAFRRIVDKNVFLPYKPKPRPVVRRDPEPVQMRTVEIREIFTLRGVYWDAEESVYRMLTEESGGKVRIVAEGDVLGGYTVGSVSLDGLTLTKGETTLTVALGEEFQGEVIGTRQVAEGSSTGGRPDPSPGGATAGSEPTGTAGTGDRGGRGGRDPRGSGDEGSGTSSTPQVSDDRKAELLRRMRERRQQQQGEEGTKDE